MTNKELKEKALLIAFEAHKEQKDKVGENYCFHPLRVAEKCSTEKEYIVALLHDTLEDTDITSQKLKEEGFSDEIIEAILSVTKQEDESYEDFIRRCSLNPIGRQVKIHDLEHNMDITRLDVLKENDLVRLNKYLKAYKFLKQLE